ncbi:hypothetical protein [Microbispora sp. H10949]|uniref:hypothetical protein n=1 Tax=Microbispora sp. H10949 TaxID=2729111 RepID=UPI00160208D2|nr:hypothetical protein [Microbispora sp. H10949]
MAVPPTVLFLTVILLVVLLLTRLVRMAPGVPTAALPAVLSLVLLVVMPVVLLVVMPVVRLAVPRAPAEAMWARTGMLLVLVGRRRGWRWRLLVRRRG